MSLDPDHAPYHVHPVQLAVALHRDSALAARRRARHPNPEALEPAHSLAMTAGGVLGEPTMWTATPV